INSVVQAGRDELIEPSIGYAGGIEAERLFWRNLSRHGMARSLAEHTVVNAIELVHAIAAPRRAARVLGRLAGWCEYPSHLRHWHELAQEAHYGPAPDDDCTSAIPPPLGLVRYRLNQPARSLADA
ncbi:MAG TPA: hypothetical protein VG713_08110, partial [Pirellulales bacterium]|nr:hypothetical protein [Pirellulales bacterium]